MLKLILAIAILSATGLRGDELEPGAPFDYPKIAFYPERWVAKKVDKSMLPWTGKEIVFVTENKDHDRGAITSLVKQLDAGWILYRDIVGTRPRPFKTHGGKPTLASMPAPGLTCGYGCGQVGATGIEMNDVARHLGGVKKDPLAVPHAYFYEMGRNYFVFGHRHSCYTTGYAVFMRYVCMDTLELHDIDGRTRTTIDDAIERFEKNDMSFLDALTNHGSFKEKDIRLKDETGRPIIPSDQPVLYASLMLKLRDEFGGNDFVSRFYREILTCPSVRPVDQKTARTQCLSMLVCASVAAKTNLTEHFTKKWKLSLEEETVAALAKIEWETAIAKSVLESLRK